VERAKERECVGLNVLPRYIKKNIRTSSQLEEENKDATKLGNWKQGLKGFGTSKCSDEVRDYLDQNLFGWRMELQEKAMEQANAIVERANKRVKNKLKLLPRTLPKILKISSELEQEHKDAVKIRDWKRVLKGFGHGKCSDKVRDYLDQHLPGWRVEIDFDKKAMEQAKSIAERANKRVKNKLNLLPRQCCKNKHKKYTENELQEHTDAQKLRDWRLALKGIGHSGKCSGKVRDYLDQNLFGWRMELQEKAMEQANAIVERAIERQQNELNLLPRKCCKNKQKIINKKYTEHELQEHADAIKLGNWKSSLNGSCNGRCSDEVRDYLDKNLPGWRPTTPKTHPITSSETKTIEEEPPIPEESVRPKKSMKLKKPSKKPKKETSEQKKARVKTEISVLHQKYKTMNSENLYKEFQENPQLWNIYHEISEENEKSFSENEIPRNRIIAELNKTKTKRTKLVVDMGCGKGQISTHFSNDKRFQFINYDHVSSNDTIISCDISNLSLEEDTVEICILSLAMWGSNCKEYVKEANRILESGGKLYIIEPTKRWSEQDENKNIIEGKEGSKMKLLLEENGFQIVEQSIEKFCMFVCIKV
jgi:ubiquinone/menaquinone biosynthesis C-methylase UbiE